MESDNGSRVKKVVLVGNPNVGKSVVFRRLTGRYVIVSNYPGTTIEISRGKMRLGGVDWEVIDTPGVNSLVPQSEDERVTCEILLSERPDLIIQVADAKNLRRTMLVTSQLVEFGIPLVLVLNMMDEAQERGIEIDSQGLAQLFGIPVVETVAIYGQGMRQLYQALQKAKPPKNVLIEDGWSVEPTGSSRNGDDGVPAHLAMEWIGLGDRSFTRQVEKALGSEALRRVTEAFQGHRRVVPHSVSREITQKRREFLDSAVDAYKKTRQRKLLGEDTPAGSKLWLAGLILGTVLFAWSEGGGLFGFQTPHAWAKTFVIENWAKPSEPFFVSTGLTIIHSLLFGKNGDGEFEFGLVLELVHFLFLIAPIVLPFAVLINKSRTFTAEVGIMTRRPLTGIPMLVCALLLVYEFVGYTGAQTLVGLLEEVFFGQHLVPFLQQLVPPGFFFDLFLGKYGLISMGLSYAIALVLPVMATFFIAFGLLEDSGYIPRLAILSDKLLRAMGLNGKAILPMVLGLGCDTMATMTTRILNSPKERLIATLLLALGVPCSAQLGVILGIASGYSSKATLTVIGVVAMQLVLVGYFSSKLIKGERSDFIFEIPPIRVPQVKNVALKTGYRIKWYLKEAVPLFLYGTLVLFVADKIHVSGRSLLGWVEVGLAPLLSGILHLPSQAAGVFVLGFLRRDYGAAGLFAMAKDGLLTGQQAVVSLIVITLFVPCLASFLMIVKEQGLKKALGITGFIIPFAITIGAIVSWILRTFNITFE
jgi:ferrous iron transport protein B